MLTDKQQCILPDQINAVNLSVASWTPLKANPFHPIIILATTLLPFGSTCPLKSIITILLIIKVFFCINSWGVDNSYCWKNKMEFLIREPYFSSHWVIPETIKSYGLYLTIILFAESKININPHVLAILHIFPPGLLSLLSLPCPWAQSCHWPFHSM